MHFTIWICTAVVILTLCVFRSWHNSLLVTCRTFKYMFVRISILRQRPQVSSLNFSRVCTSSIVFHTRDVSQHLEDFSSNRTSSWRKMRGNGVDIKRWKKKLRKKKAKKMINSKKNAIGVFKELPSITWMLLNIVCAKNTRWRECRCQGHKMSPKGQHMTYGTWFITKQEIGGRKLENVTYFLEYQGQEASTEQLFLKMFHTGNTDLECCKLI